MLKAPRPPVVVLTTTAAALGLAFAAAPPVPAAEPPAPAPPADRLADAVRNLIAPAPDDPGDNDTLAPPPANPLVARLLARPGLSEARRRALRLHLGRWDGLVPQTPEEAATLALARGELTHPALTDPAAPAGLRAEAALARGEADAALDLLDNRDAPAAAYLRARAHEARGDLAAAAAALAPLRTRAAFDPPPDPVDRTAVARAVAALARLEGRPSEDYGLTLELLGSVTQDLDPAHWPAHVAEGDLLATKDNRPEAAAAYEVALALNPRAAGAWYGLGRLAVDGFDFATAAAAAARLRELHPLHPLADALDVRARLRQRDAAGAHALLEPARQTLPRHRELNALHAAAAATAYDDDGLQAALDHYETLAPGAPDAYLEAGRHLAGDRQYGPAAELLAEAVRRSPNDPAPRLALGEMLVQEGDLVAARSVLAVAVRLDPFHRGINNQLQLVEALLDGYATLETEHFLIRYRPGIDEALARDMPGPLEAMYRDITGVFGHRPAHRTQIDLMPDKSHFAVRITGMPHFITIAAATGDVIALTPPRSGPNQADPFNWVNVLRHEFVHTVTLAATKNRVPHWFTEACAVSQETTGRTYATCRMLAHALTQPRENGGLFAYDKINFGFIRPEQPNDRPLAYAQSDWMLEYIANRWGHDAIVRLLERYREGTPDAAALQSVLGIGVDTFMSDFRGWAAGEVARWGLAKVEVSDAVRDAIDTRGGNRAFEQLLELTEGEANPAPDLLEVIARRAVSASRPDAERHVRRYAAARPVDPWPHETFVALAEARGEPEAALGSLQALDRGENYSSRWSRKLATLHRDADRLDPAQRALERALRCEPYDAELREHAAAVALQRRDPDLAEHHITALTLLEPDRQVHQKRLEALRNMPR